MSPREALQKRLSSLEFRKTGLRLGLTGAPGIGKSFMARGVLSAAGMRHVRIRANMDGMRQALAWSEVLGGQIRHLPEWVQAGLRRWQSGDALEAENIAQMLAVCARSQAPFVVWLEDWHEVSGVQTEAWEVVLRAWQGLPGVGVLVTSRNSLPLGCEAISLEPLSKIESLALLEVEALEAHSLPEAMLNWVWERGRGNPLFLLEYFRDLRQRGQLWFDGGSWKWREPNADSRPLTLEALIERVLDRIGNPATKRLLLARAVLARAVLGRHDDSTHDDPAFWEAVTDLATTDLNAAQIELEQIGILSDNQFSHPLYLEIALAQSNSFEKQQITAKACGFLEESAPIRAAELSILAGFDAERTLGFHLRAVAKLESDPFRAALCKAHACEFAQGELRLTLALEAARVLIQSDLKAVPRLAEFILELQPLHLEALGLRGRALARLGEINLALEGLEQIAPNEREGEWWRWLAIMLVEAKDFAGLHKLVLDHQDWNLEFDAEIAAGVAQFAFIREGAQASVKILERALSQNTDPTAKARLLIAQTAVLVNTGAFEQAEPLLQELIQTPQALIPKRLLILTWHNFAIVAHGMKLYDEAARRYTVSAKLALEVGDQWRYLDSQNSIGGLYFDNANFAAAEKAFLEARSLATMFPVNADLVLHDGWLSELYTCWSPPHGGALSLKYAHAGLRLARQLEDAGVLFQALYYAICAEAVHGDPSAALRYSQEMSALTHDADQEFTIHSARGLTLSALGRKIEAIAALERAASLLAQLPNQALMAAQNGLELDRLRNDLKSARGRLQFFREQHFGPGIVTAQRYFPLLSQDHAENTASNPLRLEVLGSIRLSQDGEMVAVRGAKRKLLLSLLLEAHLAGQAEVRSVDLGEALYPNANDDEAKAAIKQLVFQLRAQIGTDSVLTTTNGYALRGLQSDAQIFLETGDPDLWRGVYLTDVQGIEGHALETVREALYGQLKRRAEALLSVEPAQSARLARILMEAEPFDTDALALALRALQALGNYVSISRIYKRSRAIWLEVGERLPDRWTDFLGSTKAA